MVRPTPSANTTACREALLPYAVRPMRTKPLSNSAGPSQPAAEG
jgi:hypothetical protein